VAQYGASHTLARPKTPTRSENRTLAAARNVFRILLSRRPARLAPDPPHAPPASRPPGFRLAACPARPLASAVRAAPPPRPPPESDHHVASPPPAFLRHFWPPRCLSLAAWQTAACPPLIAALAVAAWLERSVERKKVVQKDYFLTVNC
jgi:hypothetical protein